MSQKYEDIFNTTICILYIYTYIYMDKTDFNVYFFKYCFNFQGNYMHLINVGLFLNFVFLYCCTKYITFHILYVARISYMYIVFKLLFIKQKTDVLWKYV